MEMSENVYELLKTEVEHASSKQLSLSQISEHARFFKDSMNDTLMLEIDIPNSHSSNISFYANLKNFFKYLSAYDEDNTVKAYFYLKGVTEDTTNEELFSK